MFKYLWIIFMLCLTLGCAVFSTRESLSEKAAVTQEDANNDGKPDIWMYRSGSKVLRVESDSNFDGKVDCWTYFKGDLVDRIEADTNYDGKVDTVKK